MKKKTDYKSAGVNIDAGNEAVDLIKENVKSTHSKNVLTGLGSFGSLYDLSSLLDETYSKFSLALFPFSDKGLVR